MQCSILACTIFQNIILKRELCLLRMNILHMSKQFVCYRVKFDRDKKFHIEQCCKTIYFCYFRSSRMRSGIVGTDVRATFLVRLTTQRSSNMQQCTAISNKCCMLYCDKSSSFDRGFIYILFYYRKNFLSNQP